MTRAALLACILATAGCTQQFTGPVILNVMADNNSFEQLAETLADNRARTDVGKDAAP